MPDKRKKNKVMVPKLVSLIVPFYNEAEVLSQFHRRIDEVLSNIPGYDFELVCVDDGSTDSTMEQLKNWAQTDSRVLVIELTRNFGKEAALSAGLHYARGDAVIPLDADLQDPPELIGPMLQLWEEGTEIVNAKREDRSSDSWLKRKTASIFYSVHNKLASPTLPKNVGDFRLLDKTVVEVIRKLPERQRFMKGIFAWVGFKTKEIHYTRHPRPAGHSKFSGLKLWNFALEGITSFSTVPLRVWTYIGSAVAGFALIWGSITIIKTIILGVDVPGYASTLVAVLFLGGLQLISIGVLGEYIGRIYTESKQRPLYLVRNLYRKETSPSENHNPRAINL